MSIQTIVGNTTLSRDPRVTVASEAAKREALLRYQLKRALACLPNTCQEHTYIKQRLQFLRADVKRPAPTRYVTLSYQGQTCQANAAKLREAWLGLRHRIRDEIRTRRHNMREVCARQWAGFMRQSAAFPIRPEQATYQGGVEWVRRCGVHMEPNQVRLAYVNRLRRNLFQSKAPRNDDARRWVSVEIECILGTSQDTLCDEVLKLDAAKYVCVKGDGSLRRNEGDRTGIATEIVVSAPREEIENAIKLTCQALAACKAYVNKTCGLHIHFDMRNFDHHTAFSNLVAGQKILRLLVPEHRVKNRFCKPVGRRDWPVNNDRYKAINHCAMNRHRTIEVRLFAGCIDAQKINSYVKLCSGMAYAKEAIKRAPSNPKAWQKVNPEALDNNLLDWVKSEAREIALVNESERALNQAQVQLF